MLFEYRAYSRTGKAVSGVVNGLHEQDVIAQLGENDLLVVALKQISTRERVKQLAALRIPTTVLALFTRELATLARAGLPMVRSLDRLGQQADHAHLAALVKELKRLVEGGASLSEALGLYPGVFSRVYIAMVKAGEDGGMLPDVLERLAGYLEMTVRLRDRICSAMMYPIVVILLGIGISLFMITKIIPVFVDIYKDFGKDLPLPTLILINASTWVRTHLWLCLAAAVLAVFGLRLLRRTPAVSRFWDKLKLHLPVFGPLVRMIAFARFSHTLSALLHNGVPVLKALDIAGSAIDNSMLESAVSRVGRAIEQGATLHDAMSEQGVFPPIMLEMVGAGEESGTVDQLLGQVAEHYDRRIESTLNGLTSMLEPILIVCLGIIVGAVVIAMFLPIFRMTEAIQF